MGFVPDYVADQSRQPSFGDMLSSAGSSLWGSVSSVGSTVASAAQSILGGGGGGGGYGLGGTGILGRTEMGGGGMSPGGYPWLTDMGGGGPAGGSVGEAVGGGVGGVLQSLPFLDMYGGDDGYTPGHPRPMNAGDIYRDTGEVVYT